MNICIIGAGIIGASTAVRIKRAFPVIDFSKFLLNQQNALNVLIISINFLIYVYLDFSTYLTSTVLYNSYKGIMKTEKTNIFSREFAYLLIETLLAINSSTTNGYQKFYLKNVKI
jgi:hypothetical protein